MSIEPLLEFYMHILGLLLLIAYLGGNTYIYIRGLSFSLLKKSRKTFRVLYSVLYWFLTLLFLMALGLRNWLLPEWLGHSMYQIGHVWLAFTLYMLPLLLLSEFIRLFKPSFNKGFSISFFITIIVLGIGYYNYLHPEVTSVNISIDKPLADSQKEYKVVLLSDLHLGYGRGTSAIRHYVKMVEKEQPDLVLIAGDLIDNSSEAVSRLHLDRELSKMKARDGVYVVLGNHEYISGVEGSMDFISRLPFHLLRDEVYTLPNGIQLIGRDDKSNSGRESVKQLAEKTALDAPIILLDHQPFETEQAEDAGIDLQVSGHTHNGQLWPFTLITRSLFRVSYGYQQFGNFHLYVSSGLGLWGPPLRIGTKSELVVLNLSFN